MPLSFSHLAIIILDVNFINPYKTAGFLFFNDKEDAKKTDDSVMKVKGCIIDVHEDINNLPSLTKLPPVHWWLLVAALQWWSTT